MKILIAVIAYNEEKNIVNTLKDLQSHKSKYNFDIVVIDNGSSDGTREVALGLGVPVVSHCTNTGSSMGTVMTYFIYAHKNNYDVLCQFDADGQHIASELPKIIDPVLEGRADYMIGSRFLKKEGFQSYFFRRIGITIFSKLVSFITGQPITDVTSGFRAYSKKVINFFAKTYPHELYDTNQLLLLSYSRGAVILEVPILMQERKHGTSEFALVPSVLFPIKGIINIMGCVLQSKKMKA